MVIYLVGGAVRDFFLREIKHEKSLQQKEIPQSPEVLIRKKSKDSKALNTSDFFNNIEKDWVVVGATPEDMLAQAYRPVGKSFPVFLDPIKQEEYALARIERKIGKGYTGFECFTSPDVTLEDDLKRRDLTINAMALPIDKNNQIIAMKEALIDPFGGYEDLKKKIFRHISPAFAEDPVRILRLARFAARWGDFIVDTATNELMKVMVQAGEVDALTPERVWQEFSRALQEASPLRFFEVLDNCGSLSILFPEFNMEQLKKNLNAILTLEKLSKEKNLEKSQYYRFVSLLHFLSPNKITDFCNRYRVPNDFRDLASLVARFYESYLEINKQNNAENFLKFFEQTDAFRRKDRFQDFMFVCIALSIEYNVMNYSEASRKKDFFEHLLNIVMEVSTQSLVELGFKGPEFAAELRKLRIKAIENSLV